MLVVSRKLNEGVRIGPNCIVKVVEIRGGEVRLGFEAPESVRVLRTELEEFSDTPPGGGFGSDSRKAA